MCARDAGHFCEGGGSGVFGDGGGGEAHTPVEAGTVAAAAGTKRGERQARETQQLPWGEPKFTIPSKYPFYCTAPPTKLRSTTSAFAPGVYL